MLQSRNGMTQGTWPDMVAEHLLPPESILEKFYVHKLVIGASLTTTKSTTPENRQKPFVAQTLPDLFFMSGGAGRSDSPEHCPQALPIQLMFEANAGMILLMKTSMNVLVSKQNGDTFDIVALSPTIIEWM